MTHVWVVGGRLLVFYRCSLDVLRVDFRVEKCRAIELRPNRGSVSDRVYLVDTDELVT